MSGFKCPKCGGWAFGSRVNAEALSRGEVVIDSRECHSDENGIPESLRYGRWNDDGTEYTGPFPRPGTSKVRCGWRGSSEECGLAE